MLVDAHPDERDPARVSPSGATSAVNHQPATTESLLKQLAQVDLLYIDYFGLSRLADQTKRDLLEILEDRYDKKSTLITSQLPVDQWYAYIDEPTLADAILDRLVHNSHRVNLKGGSMRKRKSAVAIVATS